MTKDEVQKLINSLKGSTAISTIFGNRVAYNAFESDQDGLGLLVQPMNTVPYKCLKNELVQFQIIDKKDGSTSLDMKGYSETAKSFLIGNIKTFSGFETVLVGDTGDEILLKNNKERYVYTFRLNFVY